MLFKNIIIINLIMMAYITEFGMISIYKFKYNPVRNVHAEAPDMMTFGVQFLNPQRRVERIIFEKLCFFYRLLLYSFWKSLKELIKCRGSKYLHLFNFNELRERFSLRDTAFFVVFLREIKEFKEFFSVKSCGVAERLKFLFHYFYVNTLWCLLYYCCLKFRFHKYAASLNVVFYRLTILLVSENVKDREEAIAHAS